LGILSAVRHPGIFLEPILEAQNFVNYSDNMEKESQPKQRENRKN
jgi:hypothetical protein